MVTNECLIIQSRYNTISKIKVLEITKETIYFEFSDSKHRERMLIKSFEYEYKIIERLYQEEHSDDIFKDKEDFYILMQLYRHSPLMNQKKTIIAYKNIIKYINNFLKQNNQN